MFTELPPGTGAEGERRKELPHALELSKGWILREEKFAYMLSARSPRGVVASWKISVHVFAYACMDISPCNDFFAIKKPCEQRPGIEDRRPFGAPNVYS